MSSTQGHIKIPLPEAVLSEAANLVDDPSYWEQTMPPILYFYRMSVGDYWGLTVYQHRLLWDWLVEGGMVNADEKEER
jgi:hypothetical protein